MIEVTGEQVTARVQELGRLTRFDDVPIALRA
jgi:hypothetical protein